MDDKAASPKTTRDRPASAGSGQLRDAAMAGPINPKRVLIMGAATSTASRWPFATMLGVRWLRSRPRKGSCMGMRREETANGGRAPA